MSLSSRARRRIGFVAIVTAATMVLMGTGTLGAHAEEAAEAPPVKVAVVAAEEVADEVVVEEATVEETGVEESAPAEEAVVEAPAVEEAAAERAPSVESAPVEAAPVESTPAVVDQAAEAAAEEVAGPVNIGPMYVTEGFWYYGYETIHDPLGNLDTTVFDKGSQESQPNNWRYDSSADPSGPADIGDVHIGSALIDDDPWLYVGFHRGQAQGSAGFFLELNQKPNTTNNYGTPVPDRTVGDIRLSFPAQGGSFGVVTVETWTGTGWTAHTLPAGSYEMLISPDQTHVEFKFDMYAVLGAGDGFECGAYSFNSMFLRSQAGLGGGSELKDFVTGPVDVGFCSDIIIEKRDMDGNILPGATFTISPNPITKADETLTLVDNEDYDKDARLGVIKLEEVYPGTYTVTETAAPEGYLLPAERSQTLEVEAEGTITFVFNDPMIWKAPTISKTVDASFDAHYKWLLDKKANGEDGITEVIRAGESYDIEYTIVVTHDGRTLTNYQLGGEITVNNPNAKPMDVTLTDQLNGTVDCTVDGGPDVTLAPGDNTVDYTCVVDGATPKSGSNVATLEYENAKYPAVQAHVDDPENAGTTTVSTDPVDYTFVEKVTNNMVAVTDQFGGEEEVVLGMVTASPDGTLTVTDANRDYVIDGSTVTFTLTRTITPEPGSCEALTNTAKVLDLSDTVEVEVCADADLEIEKTVNGSYGKTHDWSITKVVDPKGPINLIDGETSATVEYTVAVTYGGYQLDVSTVTGTITVTNPNDWAKDYVVTDTFAGTDCTVVNPRGTIPANDSVTLSYSCDMQDNFVPGDEDYNVARVDFTVAGEKAYAETDPTLIEWDATEMYAVVDVHDWFMDEDAEHLGTLRAADYVAGERAATYTYERTLEGVAGECVTFDNTAKVVDDDTVLDEDDASVEVCSEKALEVSKTVEGSYDLTHLWSIDKSVDPTKTEVTGNEATLAYDVVVTYDGYETSSHMLAGTVTIDNPNSWERNYSVEDVFAGVECEVVDATGTIPAKGSVTLTYSCDLGDDFTPGDDDTNVATVVSTNIQGLADEVAAEAVVEWEVTELQNPVTVTDEFRDEALAELGVIGVGDDGTLVSEIGVVEGNTVTFSYTKTVTLESGECITVHNVAKVVDGEVVIDEDDASSEICAEADLIVSKTAEASATVEYHWLIEKKAVETDLGVVKPGSTITAEYVVTVTPDGYEITEAALVGTFTITNPNAYKSVEVDITDVISDGAWDCTYDGGPLTVGAGETEVVTYTCGLGDDDGDEYLGVEGTNTVFVTWTNADGEEQTVEYTVEYTIDVTELDKTITVKDRFGDDAEVTLGTVEWSEDEATEFAYSRDIVVGHTPGKFSIDNTAWIVETSQDDDETVEFEVPKPQPKPGLPKTGVGSTPDLGTAMVLLGTAMVLLATRRKDDME